MITFLKTLAFAGAAVALVGAASAEASTPFLSIPNEPPPRLIVDAPDPARLAAGVAIIPYRTENLRIAPVFGEAALSVSPRIGHLHITVDDLPWRWADASGAGAVVVNKLPPGPHKILIELALPNHSVVGGETVRFTIPAQPPAAAHDGH